MEPLNPYAPPTAAADSGPKPLGSLAQSARGKEINQARWILIAIGFLTMAGNGFFLYNTPNEVRQVLAQQGNQLNPAQVEGVRQSLTAFCYLIYGGLSLLGFLFIVFGLIVKAYPLPITIASLVLYILANALLGYLNPMAILQGAVLKVFVVVGLFKAIKAARAYESDTKQAVAAGLTLE